jgi:hypothetical protein
VQHAGRAGQRGGGGEQALDAAVVALELGAPAHRAGLAVVDADLSVRPGGEDLGLAVVIEVGHRGRGVHAGGAGLLPQHAAVLAAVGGEDGVARGGDDVVVAVAVEVGDRRGGDEPAVVVLALAGADAPQGPPGRALQRVQGAGLVADDHVDRAVAVETSCERTPGPGAAAGSPSPRAPVRGHPAARRRGLLSWPT